jgi:hypothetical protein
MIKILNSSYALQAIIKNAINPKLTRELTGAYSFTFACVLDSKTATYVNENNIVEVESDYFDIISYEIMQNSDGTLTINVECEHISYRLNDPTYDLDTFADTGTVTHILTTILSGTGFSVGTVDSSSSYTYSATEKKSRRQLLMEFAEYIDAEIDFLKLAISLVDHIGSTTRKRLIKTKNIVVASKKYNKRELDSLGNPMVNYSVKPVQTTDLDLAIGDDITLTHPDLNIDEDLRIVKVTYNPYDDMDFEIEISNIIASVESQIYRIETTTVAKEKIYNGCKIGPDEGFVALRSDGKAKTMMSATEGISIYGDVGAGLVRNFYVDTAGRIQAKSIDIADSATFAGSITIGSGNNVFKANTNGIYLGNAVFASAPFRVTQAGAVTANNLTLTGGSLTLGSGDNIFKVDSTGNMWLGDADYADAPFQVSKAGILTARGAYITGAAMGNPSSAGLYFGSDYMGFHNGNGLATGWTAYIKNDSGAAKFKFSGDASNYIEWTGSALNVRGALNASDITAGTLSATYINTSGLASEKIYQAGSPNNYGTIGGSYADLALYYNNSEYFRIENALGGAVSFKVAGTTYPISIYSTGVDIKKQLYLADATSSGNYTRQFEMNTSGLQASKKNNSGTVEWDGEYIDPPNYEMGMTKANYWKFRTKFDVSADLVKHYAASSSNSGTYITTDGLYTTARNSWNFDNTLKYGGVDIDNKYVKNIGTQVLSLQYYGGYLEIYDGSTYIGKCTIIT